MNDHVIASKTRFHCCVPLCNGDSRYNPALSFHRFPKDSTQRSAWIIKVRRDEGPYFKVSMYCVKFYLLSFSKFIMVLVSFR